MEIKINDFEFWNMEAQNYYSFTAAFKGNKTAKAKELVLSGNYLGSRKMDGAWNMIIRDNEGNFHLRSRKAGVGGGFTDKAEWIPHITDELAYMPNGSVLVGEIFFPDNEGSRKITSVLNCLKEKCIERQKTNGWLHFYAFDIIAWDGKNLIDHRFDDRISKLSLYVQETDHIHIANYVDGAALWDMYNEIIAAGGEGIVITRKDCKYLPGKRTAWMTLKLKKELREPIDAFVDGEYKPAEKLYTGKNITTWPYWINFKTGERFNTCQFAAFQSGVPVEPVKENYFKGWAGSISFSVYDGDQIRRVAWISNVPNQIKEEIISNPEKWKNKVAQLTGMEVEAIDGSYSLRHGKIETWRDDKNPEDCLYSQLTQ